MSQLTFGEALRDVFTVDAPLNSFEGIAYRMNTVPFVTAALAIANDAQADLKKRLFDAINSQELGPDDFIENPPAKKFKEELIETVGRRVKGSLESLAPPTPTQAGAQPLVKPPAITPDVGKTVGRRRRGCPSPSCGTAG